MIFNKVCYFVLIILFFSKPSMGFVYRLFYDTQRMCEEKFSDLDDQTANHICSDNKLKNNNSQVSALVKNYNSILSDYNDLACLKNRSQKIINQSTGQIQKFDKFKKELQIPKNLSGELLRINKNAELLTAIEYKIALLKERMPRCFVEKQRKCAEESQAYHDKHLKPLLIQKSKHLFDIPILAQKETTSFINDQVNKRLNKHKKIYSKNFDCLQNSKIKNLFSFKKHKCLSKKKRNYSA